MLGALSVAGGLGIANEVAEGRLTLENPALLLVAVAGGAVALVFGLAYASVRSVLARRWLAPDRYRGPSPIILLILAFIAGSALVLPFVEDVQGLEEGRAVGLLASLVALTSLQVMLLVVTQLFVVWPRALAGAPAFDGGRFGRSISIGLGWGVGAWLLASVTGVLVQAAFKELGLPIDPQPAQRALAVLDPVIAVTATVVVAPLAEEVFFRGVVYNAWRREHGIVAATLGSSALFAVIHGTLVVVLPIFVLGLVLARVYERTRSLLATIVVHATVNGISVTLALLHRYEVINLPT